MEHTHARHTQTSQSERTRAKVIACGIMIGSALFFPLANTEEPTLTGFLLSAPSFHALHIEPFIRFGRFTAAVAFTLLLVAVLVAGPSRTELIPWLPLFSVALSLITVVIHDIFQYDGDVEDEFSGVSIDAQSNRSLRTVSTQPRAWPPLESNRLDSVYFARHGPSSTASARTGTDVTDITLTDVVGQWRPQWDDRTRIYFPEAVRPDQERPMEEPHAKPASPEGHGNPDVDSDLDSDRGTVEPDQPLLGPQGGVSY
ncbi:hypothetical protein F5144DRAFT_638126 [Chaetomium tenue]|uniref:Uncharacterized protein n=1 Tax=Chaetomium tenue TaxID=1854479 RepID=A0ACB7PTF4_9PEZI|nr:hypothetical protein F5144DRAFT_638126 [Chaetomium globosum]